MLISRDCIRRILFAGAAVVMLSSLALSGAHSREWYVAVDGSGDAPTIQAAIDSTSPGDEVVVGPGRYTWTGQGGQEAGMICFWTRDMYITLRSEQGPDATVLDAEYRSRVIYCHGQNRITIEGFTITRGEAPDFGDRVGGGLFTHIPGETVRDCVFTANRALHGGGISCVINDRYFTAERCVFRGNHAEDYGGAVSVWNGSSLVTVEGCVMEGNTAGLGGAALMAYNCRVEAVGCTFYANVSGQKGSVAHVHTDASISLMECTVCDNGEDHSLFSSVGTSALDIRRTIVAFNHGSLFDLSESVTGTVDCSDFFGNGRGDSITARLTDGGRNISLDPLFCGVSGSRNYLLRSDSPCFPANRPDGLWCSVIGSRPVGCGTTGSRKGSWGAVKVINPR